MDSSFFNLETDGNVFKRLKSKDVLRFIVGFHQEVVSELEVRLERIRADRLKAEAGAAAIRDALTASEIGSDLEIQAVRMDLESKLHSLDDAIQSARSQADLGRTHAMDTLRNAGRDLYMKSEILAQAAVELKTLIAKDKAHKNELLALSTRFRRSQSARAVLTGVDFIGCPSCSVTLPARDPGVCSVCGQSHTSQSTPSVDEEVLERDLDARVAELNEIIGKHEDELRKVERLARETETQRAVSNAELDRVSRLYDSAYLSANLEIEKRRAAIQQELVDLRKIEFLSRRIVELEKEVGGLLASEQAARKELREARQKAESDTKNLSRLRDLFLDCLVRAKIPGFVSSDVVEMKPPHFLPEVSSAGSGDLAVTSFANLGSGGKKTLFKCCFAIAVHRLASEIGALLPTLLIIDSPMKNISERENREQFEGFFELLYQLSTDELRDTQFILIDKELCPPPTNFEPTFLEKHMRPNAIGIDPSQNPFPPLIRYYIGK